MRRIPVHAPAPVADTGRRWSSPRRRRVALAVLLVLVALPGLLGGQAAEAQDPDPPSRPDADASAILVINVSGLIDPVVLDFVERSIADAESKGATALIIQLNSEGSVVDDDELADLATRMVEAEVPVNVWVGPSGAKALGAAAELVGVATGTTSSGMAPGTRVGKVGRQRLPVDEFGPIFGENTDLLLDETVGAPEALDLGVVTTFGPVEVETPDGATTTVLYEGAPTVGDFIINLPGVEVREIEQGDEVRREPITVVFFSRLSVIDQLAHTVASPAVAYLLLVIALGLLIFELFTAGIGIAGVVGAVCWILSCYGLWVLPTIWWAVGLVLFAFFGFAVDVQTGVPRLWTIVGVVAFIIGSFTLFDGLSLSWITLLAGIVGVLVTFYAGMPAMVRTRFSTPTIGREWMIGEMGTAVTDIDHSGVVRIRDAQWRAETNRATPISQGDPIRVVAIDHLLVEVEPETGGARDYRDRSGDPATDGDGPDQNEPDAD